MTLKLSIVPGTYAICRLSHDAELPHWGVDALNHGQFTSITRTAHELSIVCEMQYLPEHLDTYAPVVRGWRCLMLHGPFDLTETGILARLANTLADAGVSLFASATYDTDYVLVSDTRLETAVAALRAGGYEVADFVTHD